MMTLNKIQLVVHYVMMIIVSEWFVETRSQIQHASERNQSKGNLRDIYYTTTFDQDISRRSRSSTELPVKFKVPDFGSQNFWNCGHQEGPNRRTFFEDFKYLNYGNSKVYPNLNSFFEFMSPLFDRENSNKRKQPQVPKPSEPYAYEYPFKYLSSTERNFLPPPKPLRASIVKLETVTKPPDWQVPYEHVSYQDLPKQVPKYSNEKTPSFHIDELGFHSNYNINFGRNSDWLAQKTSGKALIPIVETLDEVQTAPPQFSTISNLASQTSQTNLQESLKEDNQSNYTTSTFKSTNDGTEYNSDLIRDDKDTAITEIIPGRAGIKYENDEDSKKALQLVIRNTVNKYKMINNLKINNELNNDTVVDTAEGALFVKPAKADNKSNTIKIVTDLTLEGLQKNKKGSFNVPRYTKFLNMSNLISYELNKLKQNKLMKPRSDVVAYGDPTERMNQKEQYKEPHGSADGFANDSDELSLDLKILKDTNWDGFTTQSVNKYSPTTKDLELAVIEAETKGAILESENNSLKVLNVQNSSLPNLKDNKENVDNKTVIVETRVTKSVTKILRGRNRNNRGKLHQANRDKDARQEEILKEEKKGGDKNQSANMNPDVEPSEMENNGIGVLTFSTTENEKLLSEENDIPFPTTEARLGRTIDTFHENSTSEDQTSEVIIGKHLNYSNRRRTNQPLLENNPKQLNSTVSKNSFFNATETMPHPSSQIEKQKEESFNTTAITHLEVTTDGGISVAIESSQLKKDDNVDGMHIRRRKTKRKKSKRRRSGKRRKISSTTEATSTNFRPQE